MRIDSLSFLPLASLVAVVGCTQATGDEASSTDALSTTTDSVGNDVQVLQVWTRGNVIPRSGLTISRSPGDIELNADTTRCKALGTSTWGAWTEDKIDCSDLLIDMLKEGGVKAPSLSSSRFTISTRSPSQRYIDPDFCKLLEVRVLVKDEALNAATFKGIGFYTSNGDTFAEKADLTTVGHTTLKTGEAASVLRFTAQSTCISGARNSTSGNMYQTYELKPYARFDVPEGSDVRRFRVWESIEGNHRLGRSWPGRVPAVDSSGFDRQADLLRP